MPEAASSAIDMFKSKSLAFVQQQEADAMKLLTQDTRRCQHSPRRNRAKPVVNWGMIGLDA